MRQIIFYRHCWLLLFSLLACRSETGPEQKVVGVQDGDTITILENKSRSIKVRLDGVDAPEKNQDYGTRSRQFVSDLCFGKKVKLIERGTDRYGRVIGTVILPDGRSLNEELVRNGFAWHYKEYSKDPVLARLETDARFNRRGLWELPDPTAPWDFRQARRTRSRAATASAKAKKSVPRSKASLPGGTFVYICDSRGAAAYHASRTCSALKRCKSEIRQVTRAEAQRMDRRADKACAEG